MTPVIQLQDVYMAFVSRSRGSGRRPLLALQGVNLSIPPNSFVTLVGPSGCGKSTVLKLVAGLLQPTAGRITYKGRPIVGVNTDVGFVTQDDNLYPWRTLLDNVQIALGGFGCAPRR